MVCEYPYISANSYLSWLGDAACWVLANPNIVQWVVLIFLIIALLIAVRFIFKMISG